jgi:hypothetical protein
LHAITAADSIIHGGEFNKADEPSVAVMFCAGTVVANETTEVPLEHLVREVGWQLRQE